MIPTILTNQSPFAAIWILFLVFFVATLAAHLIGVLLAFILRRYADRLQRRHREGQSNATN